MKTLSSHLRLTLLIIAVACFAQMASAQSTYTWNGGGGDSLWGTGANWGGSAPALGSIVQFDGSTRPSPDWNYGDYDNMNQILFLSTIGTSFDLVSSSSRSIKMQNSGSTVKIENQSSFSHTLDFANISYDNGGELDPTSGDLNCNLNGTGSIFLDNNGTLHVYGNNAHTLTLGCIIANGANGNTTGGRFTLEQNSTVIMNKVSTYTGETDINAGELRIGSGGGISSGSSIYLGNGGALTTPATLSLGAASSSGSQTFGNNFTVNNSSGGQYRIIAGNNTSGNNTYSGTITVNGDANLQVASGGTLTFSGQLTTSGGKYVTSSGFGTVVLSGSSDNAGIGLNANAGITQLAKTSSSSVHAVGAGLNVNSGGTAQLGGSGSDQIFDGANVTVNSGGVLDLNGQSETVKALSLSGTGIGSAGSLINNNGSTTATLTATNGATLAVATSIGGSANISLPSFITGGNSLTKVGTGALTLSGGNTYTGNTTVSAGKLLLNGVVGATPLLYMSFDDVVGTTVINEGSGGSAMNGTLTGAGATISTGTGRFGGNALSISGSAANSSYVLINNAVVALNGNANWTVAMWVKTSTSGGCYAYQGSGGWVSGNTTFYLNNSTTGNSGTTGTHAGGVRYGSNWETGSAAINDNNWHFIVMTCTSAGVRTSYVDGNADTLTGDKWATSAGAGSQFWIGGSADTGDGTKNLGGSIDEVAVYNVALTQTQVQSLMNNGGVSKLPATTLATVSSGATLDLNGNNTAIAGLSDGGATGGTVDTTSASGTPTLFLNGSSSYTFNGVLQNSGTSSTLSLIKQGTGSQTLSGVNTFTGSWAVNAGTLNYNGSLTAGGQLSVNNSGVNSIVNIGSGANITFAAGTNVLVGNNATAAGAVFQSAGKITTNGYTQLQIGAASGAYGYYNLSGGTINISELDCGGFNGSPTGVFDISGGSVTNSIWFIMGRGTGGLSVLNMTGGSYNFTGSAASQLRMNWSANATESTIMNIANATFTAANPTGGLLDLMSVATSSAGQLAVVNLLSGGTMQLQGAKATSAQGTSHFNFNGGTLKASTANTTFLTTGLSAVNVYSGGGTIDNNGVNITIPKVLSAPAGNGLNGSVTLTSGGSGYIGAPAVTITGGGGTGATAYATISGGAVTGVIITSPGINYSSTPTITFTGGGGTGASATAPAPSANTSGGLTFQGTGTTTLYPGNTYSGKTIITNCTVNADANNTATSGQLGTADVAVNGDGTNGKLVLGTGSVTGVNNSTVTVANNFALTNAFLYVQDQKQAVSGTISIGGAGATFGSTYNNTEADKGLILSGNVSGSAPITIQHTRIGTGQPYNASFVAFNNNANSYSGTITINENTATSEGGVYLGLYQPNALANASVVANSDVPGTSLKFGNSPIVFNSGLGSATIGSISGAAKLVLTEYNTSTHAYGANSIALSAGGNNASTTYSGPISGGGSVTKMGTGTLTLSATNIYTGNTTVSNGVLKLTGNGSISNSPIIAVVGNGTFDVSAISFTVAAGQTLKGTGIVTGNVTTASSTAAIQPGLSVGTLSFSNNLNMSAGCTVTFELNTNYNSGNDLVVVGGNLGLSGSSTIHISALNGAANLDTNADYVLFAVSGTTTIATIPALIWDGTKPANYLYYTVTTTGNNVVLHYAGAIAPTLNATASPASVNRNQPLTVTATVTNGSGNIATVTVDLSQIGGSGTASLVLSNNNVYTNTFRVSAGTGTGTKSMLVSVMDDTTPTPLVGTYTLTNLVVVVTNQVWNGSGGDDNWSSNPNWTSGNGPGYSGDGVIFAGSSRLNPVIDTNYSVTGFTFDNTSGNFSISTLNNSALTLTGGLTNNSVNAQMINVPVTVSGAQTMQALAGNLTFGQNVTNTGTLLAVNNTADVTINGSVTNSGSASLLKTGAGKLVFSSNTVWNGSSAIGYVPSSTGFPLVAREGNLVLNGGGSNYVGGEFVLGGVVANGGVGQNAKITVDSAIMNVNSWFSIGRGNGTGTVSSDAVFTNGATGIAGNMSCGFNGGNAANFPKGSVTLSDTSSFTITGNGALNFAESGGSDMTMTLNNSAQFVATGTAQKFLGQLGKGTINLNDSSSMVLGNAITTIGYKSGTGAVNVTSSAVFANAGELRVGGTDANGPFSGFGSLTVSGGTVSLGALTIARGNYSGDMVSGTVTVNSGTLTSTNDVIVGFRGTNSLGKLVINGGAVNVGTASTKWLIVGDLENCRGQMDITGGNLNLLNGTAIKFSSGGTSTTSTNIVNQSGGTVTFYSDAGVTIGGSGDLNLQQSGGSSVSNTYNLDGGVLIVPAVSSALTTGTRVFNFNGGTLKPAVSTDNFFNLGAGNSFANVRNGGAIVDTIGNNVTIGQALIHSTIPGDNAPDGGLTKIGNGTLTLSNANTYTGNTAVNGGTLLVSGSIGSGAVGVATNATLRGNGIIAGAVTVNAGGTLAMGTTNALGSLTINNTLTLSGTNNFRLNKTGATLTSDKILGTTGITAGGTLNVSTNGGDALAAGDSFALFNAGMNSGWFSSVTVPVLASGISWDTNNVAASGTLDVYTFTTTTLSASTLMNTAATISAAKLTSHASSSRGTPVAATASTPGHGTASISSGALTYTPATGYSGSDTFTITFQDGHGSQTMTVNVTVGTQNVGPQLTTVDAGGYGSFTASGLPSTIYTVQISTNLSDVPPFNDYLSVTSAPNGVINFLDTTSVADHGGQTYYRLKQYVAP